MGLPEDLLDPAAYPEPRPLEVRLVTTHGSWVLLADHRVLKLKRPVDYGFMDFSTPERRLHFCREEVRLNRRLAPDVYVGVVPVLRDAAGYNFGRGGEVVDHAVHMRRLPDDRSAAALLARGELGHAELGALAERLAAFYEAAAPADPGRATADLALNVDENFRQVEPFAGRFVDASRLEEVRAWQLRFLQEKEVELRGRAVPRLVREGHGDLRLEHVYFMDGEPLVIDAIEFNERFRTGDVALDVAFLAMDLQASGRPDLGEWLLGRFAAAFQDFDLYGVVDHYLSYRAWVRGKVACFVAADPSTPHGKQARKAEEASRFFALAEACTRPAAAMGAVVAVGGLIGAGKSTLAERLSRETSWPVVSSDATRKFLAGIPLLARGDPELYREEVTERTFRELFRRAGAVLASGRGVILDATFARRDVRRRARDLAVAAGRPFLFVEAWSDDGTLRRRLRARAAGPSASDAGEDLLEGFRARWEPADELAAPELSRVDTTGDVGDAVRGIVARLRAGAWTRAGAPGGDPAAGEGRG